MKDMKNIDQYFKDSFSTYQKADHAQDWEKMEALLDQNEPVGFWARRKYYILLLLLFGLSASLWVFLGQNSPDKSQSNLVATFPDEKTEIEPNDAEQVEVEQPIARPEVSEEVYAVQEFYSPRRVEEALPQLLEVETSQVDSLVEMMVEPFEAISKPEFIGAPYSLGLYAIPYTINVESNLLADLEQDQKFVQWSIQPYLSVLDYSRTKPYYSEQEKTINSMAYGISLSAARKNWEVSSGLQILNLKELTNYLEEGFNYSYDTSYRLITRNYEITEHGKVTAQVERIIDTEIDTTRLVRQPNQQVSFTYVDIPLNLKRSIRYGRFRPYVQLGLGVSILQRNSGNYVFDQPSSENLPYPRIAGNQDLNKVLFRSSADVGLGYDVNRRIGLNVSFGQLYYHNSLLNAYNQTPKIDRLTFGLDIKL